MYRLIESIKLQNRQLQHIEWHNKRLNEARYQLFATKNPIDLQQIIEIPASLSDGVYKCRILYGENIESIEFQPYTPREVWTLKLLEADEIEYTYKYEDREALNRLFAMKGEADDILIVKNGCITDTSYSNIVFFDGDKWITPDTYLLNGTQRQRMLSEGMIFETPVAVGDLKSFKLAKPINAMLDFETTATVKIDSCV
jgi:4-amino-4-deoxychorismate lyase